MQESHICVPLASITQGPMRNAAGCFAKFGLKGVYELAVPDHGTNQCCAALLGIKSVSFQMNDLVGFCHLKIYQGGMIKRLPFLMYVIHTRWNVDCSFFENNLLSSISLLTKATLPCSLPGSKASWVSLHLPSLPGS